MLLYVTKCYLTSKKFAITIWQAVLMGWEKGERRTEPCPTQQRVGVMGERLEGIHTRCG